jgi:hypothetical protein
MPARLQPKRSTQHGSPEDGIYSQLYELQFAMEADDQ